MSISSYKTRVQTAPGAGLEPANRSGKPRNLSLSFGGAVDRGPLKNTGIYVRGASLARAVRRAAAVAALGASLTGCGLASDALHWVADKADSGGERGSRSTYDWAALSARDDARNGVIDAKRALWEAEHAADPEPEPKGDIYERYGIERPVDRNPDLSRLRRERWAARRAHTEQLDRDKDAEESVRRSW